MKHLGLILPLHRFLIVALLISLSACFDIVDEMNVNADGSGEMTLTFNLSKSKTKVASIMLMDTINGYKVPKREDVERALNEAVAHLKKEKGFSNIKQQADFENYIFSISFHFSSVQDLNKVLREITAKHKVDLFPVSYGFDSAKKQFTRSHTYNPELRKRFGSLKEEDKKIFSEATYTAILRFEQEVDRFTNTNASLSKSKKAVMIKVPALGLIRGEVNLSNQIIFKK